MLQYDLFGESAAEADERFAQNIASAEAAGVGTVSVKIGRKTYTGICSLD